MPMVEASKDYRFKGRDGPARLAAAFPLDRAS
jgi:hypothetical protein